MRMSKRQRDRLELVGAAILFAGLLYIWPPLALLALGVAVVVYANFKSDEPASEPTKEERDATG